MFHCPSHSNYQTLKARIGLVTAYIVSKRAMNQLGPSRIIFYIQIYKVIIYDILLSSNV